VQHRLDDQWTVRAGWNYGESPIDSEVVFANALFPAIVEHHLTAGASYKISDAWELGLSAYFAPEKSLTDSGNGDTYSQNGAQTKISHYQYGAQASLKWNF
ncbi:MAG: hypothetical protein OQK07_11240, partial [Rhodospirillales bacterium]|nr:hypothetical protein [Rhodospirillales bacterium]